MARRTPRVGWGEGWRIEGIGRDRDARKQGTSAKEPSREATIGGPQLDTENTGNQEFEKRTGRKPSFSTKEQTRH